MKHLTVLFAALFLAVPAFAQDDDGGGGDGPPGGGGGGGGQAQVFTRIDAVDPMDQVKTFLARANVKLSGDQERALKPQVEAALAEARKVAETAAPLAGPRGGGRRGGPGTGAGFGPGANGPVNAELRRINDDLVAKINAALKPDQQAAFKTFQSDEVRKAGGLPALRLVMQEAGAPLTPEQEQQMQALYADDTRQRFQLMRESQGRPDPAKLNELEMGTMAKVARLLNPAQRKALLDSRAKAQQ